jgi:GT2 family glycosyltransferase
MTSTPTLSIVLVTYNSAHLLAPLQASFDADPAGRQYEYIVVDNASDDAPQHAMPHAQWVHLPTNLGYGSACNRGAALARGTYVVFCNPDILVTPMWAERLLSHLVAHPEVACIAPETRYPGESLPLGGGIADRDTLPGAALMMRRADWVRFGGFDEQIFLYWEDTDLCWRAQRAGMRTVVARDAEIFHQRNGSGGGAHKWLHLYIQNGIYAHLKSQPWLRVGWFVLKQLIAMPLRYIRHADARTCAAFGWNFQFLRQTLLRRRQILAERPLSYKGTP